MRWQLLASMFSFHRLSICLKIGSKCKHRKSYYCDEAFWIGLTLSDYSLIHILLCCVSAGIRLWLQPRQTLSLSLPYTNITGSFTPISSTPSIAPQIVPRLTWATQGKEQNGCYESTELQLILTLGFPPSLLLLCVCALLQLPFCTKARNDLGESVQAVSLTVVSNSA